jgi:NAD(P)-dependent dehydrogenase (short-subunit alcohol dehydrogenase family)
MRPIVRRKNDLPIRWTKRSPPGTRRPIVTARKEIQMDNNTFKGLRVAVTGGTSGLGLALVDQLRRAGAHVAFIARDAHRVAAVALRQPGTHGIAGDVARKETIHAIALQVTAALGGLDILINNASTLGPVPLAPLADTECEDFEAALATNVLGPFRLTKALLGALASSAREGRTAVVVNISSDAAVNAYANWGAYGASKAAVAHMSRIWDEELKEHGIRVVAHDPGDMDTPMHAQAIPDADASTLKRPEQAAAELLARIAELTEQSEASA